MDYQAIRSKLVGNGLYETDISNGPFDFLNKWIQDAISIKLKQPNAMCLSTVDSSNFPTSRIVLLKEILDEKIIFYTNYNSDKSKHLEKNKNVALNFLWAELSRQVRITGTVSKTSREKSEEYFNSRPLGSKIAASISSQSSYIKSREELEEKFYALEKQEKQITCPADWGGFAITPYEFEFWQGRENRLHDRIVLSLDNKSKSWIKKRKAP